MANYKNPIPCVDDESVSKKFFIGLTFEELVTQEEAARAINDLIEQNGGKLKKEWVIIGEPKSVRLTLPQD